MVSLPSNTAQRVGTSTVRRLPERPLGESQAADDQRDPQAENARPTTNRNAPLPVLRLAKRFAERPIVNGLAVGEVSGQPVSDESGALPPLSPIP
jgi:hypothetical protein